MSSTKSALITGITGQDGSYLAELLLEKGYSVHGVVRRTSNLKRSRIEHLRNNPAIYGQSLFLHYGDLSDGTTLRRIFAEVQPSEVYHLAGQSHVGLSFEIPESTCEEIGMATLRLLEIIRDQKQPLRFYHASSSEIFGRAANRPKPKRHRCRRQVPTDARRHSRRNLSGFIGNPMACSLATGFSTIMSRRGAERILSRRK